MGWAILFMIWIFKLGQFLRLYGGWRHDTLRNGLNYYTKQYLVSIAYFLGMLNAVMLRVEAPARSSLCQVSQWSSTFLKF